MAYLYPDFGRYIVPIPYRSIICNSELRTLAETYGSRRGRPEQLQPRTGDDRGQSGRRLSCVRECGLWRR